MISRRLFLKQAGVIGLFPIIFKEAWAQEEFLDEVDWDEPEYHQSFPAHLIRVVQGVTTENSTVISVVSHRSMQMQFEVKDANGYLQDFETVKRDLHLGPFIVHKIYIQALTLDQDYTLTIWNQTLNRRQENVFRALDWSNSSAKIAILTCSNHRDRKSKKQMLLQLLKENPDVIFFAGDLVYANSALDTLRRSPAKPADAYNVYIKTIMEFRLYDQKKLTPLFTVWDDHDLAFNNCDTYHPHKEAMTQIFRTFFPIDVKSSEVRTGPGIAFSVNAFGMQIFFLDGRTHKNNRTGELLGLAQLDWIKNQVLESEMPILVISPQQFWSYRNMAESYQKNANLEFDRFLNDLKAQNRPVLFVSGDVHYSQIQEISQAVLGYKTYEITSSALFSSSARNFGRRDERQGQLAYYGYPNFIILENIKATTSLLNVNVRCVSESSRTQFQKPLSIQAVNGVSDDSQRTSDF